MKFRVALAVGGALLALCGSAEASTVTGAPDGRFQRWVDAAYVPTPHRAIAVHRMDADAPCADAAVACEMPGTGNIWIDEAAVRAARYSTRETFAHELGHIYAEGFTADDWARFADLLHRSRRSPAQLSEPLAEAYARCFYRPSIPRNWTGAGAFDVPLSWPQLRRIRSWLRGDPTA